MAADTCTAVLKHRAAVTISLPDRYRGVVDRACSGHKIHHEMLINNIRFQCGSGVVSEQIPAEIQGSDSNLPRLAFVSAREARSIAPWHYLLALRQRHSVRPNRPKLPFSQPYED